MPTINRGHGCPRSTKPSLNYRISQGNFCWASNSRVSTPAPLAVETALCQNIESLHARRECPADSVASWVRRMDRDLEFEWDEDKADSNQKKHRVTFAQAATVFTDPVAAIFDDAAHSDEEQREIIIGHSAENQLLLVCFTERAGAIRIISARRATKSERRDYEENPHR